MPPEDPGERPEAGQQRGDEHEYEHGQDAERELIAGLGAVLTADAASGTRRPDGVPRVDLPLSLGPDHPSAHGMFRVALRVRGDVIVAADPLVGHLHRGVEKLFEVRDYRQILALSNRHDWLAAFGNELGVALAAERMLGLDVPVRAVWLRTLVAELTRVLAHLAFLGPFPVPAGARLDDLTAEREAIHDLLERAFGARIHLMANQVGGLRQDVPAGWLDAVRALVATIRARVPALREAVTAADGLCAHLAGVGRLDAATAASYGVSGPAARAGGLDLDLRRDEPYLAYGELFAPGGPGRVVLGTAGDVPERLRMLVDQVAVSLDLADACLDRLAALPPGPVNVPLPKVLRLPEGDIYAATESPPGINGYYLVSRGDKAPWRLKLRTASYNNVAALPAVLPGTRVADLTAVLASLCFVVGDIDK